MKFLFTCGGTAGHVNPALGVAAKLAEIMPDSKFLFVGAEGMMETELVPRAGYDIKTIKITNVSRSLSIKGLKHNIKTAKNILAATGKAKRIIREFQPDAVIGTGGYVCYPVLSAAHALKIPTFLHESNAVPGLTTKMLAGKTDCVMVGFPEAAKNYKNGTNIVCTGTPVRSEFKPVSPTEGKRALGIPEDKKLVLSVWGSLGAAHMNNIMTDFITLTAADEKFGVIHSAGKRGYAAFMSAMDEKCPDFADHSCEIREYIHDMPRIFAAADLVMCRGGASTLAELIAMGKPAVIVPSPNVTANHQEMNARVLERAGGAKVYLEGQFTAQSLYEEVSALLNDEEKLQKMGEGMLSLATEDSAAKIAELIISRLA
ncbi:MAG: undecaprenyldiphospho-muramoylpentapeptide beta-N-acetylglucosaminyltransferase [Oscillospiraceae bacterium]|nr:undecaprenyldiphospho-muramoylpentapeptide beta-N-acetylglucosaminyltransferase [Oscillospiraceae bacterium]